MKNINSLDELDNFILNSNKLIGLYFGAEWCNPCHKFKNRLIEEASEFPKLDIAYMDVDKNDDIAQMYDVSMIPVLVFVKLIDYEIKVLDRIDGYDWTKLLFIYDRLKNDS